MTSLNISLPQPLKEYVESKVAEGDYGTPSEYVRELIRQDKSRHQEKLERQLVDALHSRDLKLDAKDLENEALVAALRKKLKSPKS